jgi:hypothetical protein
MMMMICLLNVWCIQVNAKNAPANGISGDLAFKVYKTVKVQKTLVF